MLQSQLLAKTKKNPPQDAETISHKLLMRADFINQEISGVYSFLPLGWRVHQKIAHIIRQEMNKIRGQEVSMPVLQPKDLWQETGRWDTIDPPLFKLKDRHKKDLALGPTHEEMFTNIVRKRIKSYQDLPLYLYQIQDKFRNEMRSTGGLLRTREFIMKDLYSFHTSQIDLDDYYLKVMQAYKNIYQQCGLEIVITQASSGSIGGSQSHEFMALAESGEDKILVCSKCDFAVNTELGKTKFCSKCQSKLVQKQAIEVGHIFKLGTVYSKKMKAVFTDKSGKQKPMFMGCYGIGLGRLMAAIVEAHHDKAGIIWPKQTAPFDVHLISLLGQEKAGRQLYEKLTKKDIDVLYDDRRGISAGEKFAEADLIGISVRLVISEKTSNKIEYKQRDNSETVLLIESDLISKLK